MNRWLDLKSVLLAAAFLAVGFLFAERMTPASAAPRQDGSGVDASSFAGVNGAMAIVPERGSRFVVIVRENKLWRLDPNSGTSNAARPWTTLSD